ncbi:SCO3242 family prenyltransferase [Kitasatospora sp. NBC_01539]|uniref:SCO3242 family prenyltransferase n=1 Tax=Kitasatospora sp. NBC_01539 TaxID=2903577 RepID=UPI003860264D
MTTLPDLAELVRAPAALSVPGDLVAGASAAGCLGPRTAGLAAASIAFYWAGMAANDWADRELDARERPERPIPSGRVSPATALALATGLTCAGVTLAAAAGGYRALAAAVPLAGALWAYDLTARGGAAGPPVMACCRTLNVLLGASGGRPGRALPAALAVGAHTWTVTALSRAEVSGAAPALPAATLAATLALTTAVGTRTTGTAGTLAGWYAAGYGSAQAAAVRSPTASRIREAVTAGITSLPSLQASLTARHGRPRTALALAAATVAGRLLARRMSPT